MSAPKCYKCKCSTKKVENANSLFSWKYLVQDARIYVCQNRSYSSAVRYSSPHIRKKISTVKSKEKIPAVQQVLAKAKFLVL